MFSLDKWRSGQEWRNWSESQRAMPEQFLLPRSIDEVIACVKDAVAGQQSIRVTGAAHSFSPVAKPEQVALSLHHLRGLISVDAKANEATFYAGTYLHEIGELLAPYGLALSNMGDIQDQSLAGVISTGTHGTGVTLGSFSSMVVMWGIVDGHGVYREVVRGDDDLSRALHVSLGLLGVLVKVTIQVVPLYNLRYVSVRRALGEELAQFQTSIRANRHVEWYYFPGSETMQLKQMNMEPYEPQSTRSRRLEQVKMNVFENGAFYLLSELCRLQPRMSRGVAKLSSKLISNSERTDVSYHIYPSNRLVKFIETEYAIPLMRFEEAMEEIHATFSQQNIGVHFPIECRTTSAEDGFLSPTLNRESAFIAFHMYKGMNEQFYFNWVHELMQKYDGRAHWGKVNTYERADIFALYPGASKFNEIRGEWDPHGVFLTDYFKRVFDL